MRVRVDNVGEYGLITDLDQPEIPNNAWTTVKNARLRRNYVEPILGHQSILTPTGTATYLLGLSYNSGWYMLYPADVDGDGEAETIWYWDGTSEVEITRAAGDYTATSPWSGCVLNGVAILNNLSECPQYWGGSGDCEDLIYSGTNTWDDYAGGDETYRAEVIRSYRNFLFALNIVDDGTSYPFTVHWSDPADPGTIPATWDYTDPTTLSGRVDLSDTNGRVVDGLALRDVFVIYKEDAVWVASYVGGQYQFRFDKLSDTYGVYGINCVVDIGGRHFVIGDGVVYVHDGNQIQNILEGRNADYLFEHIEPTARSTVFVAHNKPYREVWICFPDIGSVLPNLAMIYNYVHNTWALRDLPGIYYAAGQIVGATGGDSWPDEGSTEGWENDLSRSWDTAGYSPLADSLVGVGAELYQFDIGNQFDEDFPEVTLERIGIRLGEGGAMAMIRAIYPRVYGSCVQVAVGSQMAIDGEIAWSGNTTFTPGTTVKVDATQTGELHAIKFTCDTGSNWRLAGYELDVESVGSY